MNPQLPVDPGTLDAGQNAQVGGKPRGICQGEQRRLGRVVINGSGVGTFSCLVTKHGVLSMSVFDP